MKKLLSTLLTAFSILFLTENLHAQLVVNTVQTPLQMAQKIAGQGVKILNPTVVCGVNGYGSYTATATNLGSNAGVILTSGLATDAIGPNNVGNKSVQVGTAGDALLNGVTGRTTYDACTFEFDIVPEGDTLKFDYVFASEEYPEWVNSQFNDVFGFFISGPGIVGQKNIAIIPGGAPCTINTVNNGTTNTGPCTNCAYYVDNQTVPGQTIQYDGFTKNLQAISAVQPCQTYHLKLVIADASDRKWDSGVFIEQIESNNISMNYTTLNGLPQMIEGCNPATVTFTRFPVSNKILNVPFYFGGTAIKNTDYTSSNAGTLINFPANVGTATITLTPINDALAEGIEGVTVFIGNPLCTGNPPTDSLKIEIHDSLFVTIAPPKDSICPGQSVQLTTTTSGLNFSWTPATGLSSAAIKNPIASPPATTTYTLTTTAGACSNIRRSTIKVSNISLNAVSSNVVCNGQNNGSVLLNPTNGLGTYTYSWSTAPVTSKDHINLGPGTYTVTVTDSKGCTVNGSFPITQPGPITGGLTSPTVTGGFNVACNGSSTGSITTNPTGGTPPFTYTWTGPSGFTSNLQSPSGLAAGTYCVTVRDVNGCTNGIGGQCVTLTQPAGNLTATIGSSSPVSCFNVGNGSATVTPTGGTAPYTYTWNSSPIQNTATATNLPPGTYTITVRDVNACIATNTVTITQPTAPLTASVVKVDVTCAGGATGSATATAIGGTPASTYTWSNGQIAQTAVGLVAGSYTVTVRDNRNCVASVPVVITQPSTALTASITAQSNVLCKGEAAGTATAQGAGGSGAYTYTWSNGQTTATAINLIAGTYTVNVFDNNGCTTPVTLSVTITEPTTLFAAALGPKTNVFCKGACTGSATINANGGSGSYTYTWTTTPVQTTATATNLCAGSYQVTVRDANGCATPITIIVSITEPTLILSGTISNTNISCFGGNNGTVTVTPSGGSGIYDYSWSGPGGAFVNNSPLATGLTAGTYTVQIFDRNGCSIPETLQATITQPSSSLSVNIPSQTNNTCFGGSTGTATAVISGGSGTYIISWNTSPSQNVLTASGLQSGSYSVFVTDVNGCSTTVSASVTITQPASALNATTSQTNVTCKGGATGVATALPSGGSGSYNFSWITGAATTASINGLIAGTYTVYVRDNNNCPTPIIRSVTITEPTIALGGSIVSSTDILCFGANTGTATALGSGGSGVYNYTWSNGQTAATATNLAVGTYTVTIRDNNGCTNTVVLSVIITQPTAALSATINPVDITAVSCFGNNDGQIIVTASGGSGVYDYSWTGPGGPFVNNSSVAANLIAGNYTVQVFDRNGCATPIIRNATITQPAGLLSAVATTTNFNGFSIGCYNGTTNINLTVSGGNPAFTYTWSGPSTFTSSTEDLTGVAAGLYDVIVNDSKGCSTAASITLTQPADDSLAFVMTATLCATGSKTGAIDITPFGGVSPFTYNWNGPGTVNIITQDLTLLDNGSYTVIITDANGCKDTTAITVSQPSSIITNHTNSTYAGGFQVQCYGGSNGFINTTSSGGTPPYIRSWTKTSPAGTVAAVTANISGLSVGTYELLVTDQNGCIDNELVVMTEPDSITSNLAVSSIVTCNGTTTGCLSTSAIGGVPPYSYSWSGPGAPFPPNDSICNVGAGNYTVTITDASGCSNPNLEQQIIVTQPAQLSANAVVQTPILCNNQPTGAINLTVGGGSAPYTFTWTGPSGYTASTQDIFGLEAGLYSVTVRDSNLCSAITSITLTQPDPINPVANIPNPNGFNIACFGGNTGSIALTVTGGTGSFSYLWSGTGAPFGNVSTISNLVAGTYTVRIGDANGCFSSDTSFTLTQPNPIFVNDSVITLSGCNGAAGGSIKALASGGVGGYSYSWNTSPAQLTQIATNLVGGTYTVFVQDANSCSAQATAVIPTLPPLDSTLVSSSIVDVLCNGALTGSITVTTNGGLAPFNYAWTPNTIGNIANPSGLAAGFYSVVITDANNCSTSAIHFNIAQPSALNLSFTGITNVNCFGGVNGSISANVSGGTGAYNYTWSGACVGCPNSSNLTGLGAGVYNLTVSDGNSCTVSGIDSITQPVSNLNSSLSSPVVNGGYNVTCNGASTGSINLVVTGGSTPYTFTWTASGFGPAFTQNLSGLKAKTYTVVIVDSKGCITSSSITLTQPPLLVLSSVERTFIGGNNISCNGAQDGCIDATISGGTSPYTFSWTGPNNYTSTNEDICNLFAGLYILTATDANGCEVFKAVNLTEPDPLAGSLAPSFFNGGWNIGCTGDTTGFITLTVTGGTSGYQYFWSNTDTTIDIFNLAAGGYNVLVTDPNGCEFRDSITLYEPPLLLASIISPEFIGGWNISCFGENNGVDSLDVQGGTPNYNYIWVGPNSFTSTNEDISGLFAGVYTATITDDNGCILIKTDTLTEPTALDFTLASATFIGGNNISCYGDSTGSITSSVTGGTTLYSYTWNGPNVTNIHSSSIDSLVAGNYVLTVTDTNGCNLTKNIILSQPTPVSTQVIPIVVAGGFNITCRGTNTGAINLIDGGGIAPYTYSWTDSAGAVIANTANIDSLFAGTYTVYVADANGCDTTVTVTLTEPLELNDSITSPIFIGGNNLICNGDLSGSITITEVGGAGPFSHAWSGPNGFAASNDTLTGLEAGIYNVVITDANGCTKSDSITLTQPSVLALTLIPTVYVNGLNIRCFNDSSGVIIANVSGGTQGYSFSWTGPNGFNSNLKDLIGVVAGQYCLTVTDTNGCFVSQCKTLTQPTSALTALLSAPLLAGGFNVSCNGANDGSIYLNFSGGSPGFTVNWRGPTGFADSAQFSQASSDTLINLFAGTYTVVLLDTNTCAYTDSIKLTQPGNPILGILDPLVYPGGYNVTCYESNDGAIDLSVSGGVAPYTYTWNTGAQTQDISGLSAMSPNHIYTVTITDSINCFKTYSDTLIQPDTISSAITAQTYAGGYNITCNGLSDGSVNATYVGGTIGFNFAWTGPNSFTSTSQNIGGLSAGNYCLIVKDTNGCASSVKCISLSEPATMIVNEAHPPIDCSYLPSSIYLTVTGGTPSYSYSWTGPGVNGAITAGVTGLLSGNYTATVTDANLCTATLQAPVTIYVPDSLKITLTAVTFPPSNYNISNYGLSDGVISTIVTGGTLNYSYNWVNTEGTFASASQNLNNMPKGIYILRVTDFYNCSLSDTIEIREPLELQMPSGFSPNGDGFNDDFFIHGLDIYPDNTIVVFNRWGNKVYSKDGYYRDWTGLSNNGEELPDATYFVVLKIKNSDIILKGYVDLRRN